MSFVWNKENESRLLSLVETNKPIREIADALGMTPDAVRAKIPRLNKIVARGRSREVLGALPIPPIIADNPLNLTIDELHSFHCRYITSEETASATYCGHPIHKGSSWCEFHYGRMFTPRIPAKDQRPFLRA